MYRDEVLFPGALEFSEYEFDDVCRGFMVNFLDIADDFLDGILPFKYHERYHRLNVSLCRRFGIMSKWGNLNSCRIKLIAETDNRHWWLYESPNRKSTLSDEEVLAGKF